MKLDIKQFAIISNSSHKFSIVKKIIPNCVIREHNIDLIYKKEGINIFLKKRNEYKLNSCTDNLLITISHIHWVHGKVLDMKNILSNQLPHMINGKRYKIYSMVSVKCGNQISHRSSYEIYTNIFYKNLGVVSTIDNIEIFPSLMVKEYRMHGSLERSIWCLTNHLLR